MSSSVAIVTEERESVAVIRWCPRCTATMPEPEKREWGLYQKVYTWQCPAADCRWALAQKVMEPCDRCDCCTLVETEEDCPTCLGDGTEDCLSCGNETECSTCDGSGYIPAVTCGGAEHDKDGCPCTNRPRRFEAL